MSIAVSDAMAVFRVGSRSGAQSAECKPGCTVLDCLAAANFEEGFSQLLRDVIRHSMYSSINHLRRDVYSLTG